MEKLYWKISEVAEIVGVRPEQLRYWEKEHGLLHPLRKGGKRRYTRKDIQIALMIKALQDNGEDLRRISYQLRHHNNSEFFNKALKTFLKSIQQDVRKLLEEVRKIKRELEEGYN
ncbi:MerR family transcriptional regulator [Desulfurobacterium sp.]